MALFALLAFFDPWVNVTIKKRPKTMKKVTLGVIFLTNLQEYSANRSRKNTDKAFVRHSSAYLLLAQKIAPPPFSSRRMHNATHKGNLQAGNDLFKYF